MIDYKYIQFIITSFIINIYTRKKSLLIVKLRSFQNAFIEIKQISFVYQQVRFTVKKTHL